MLSPINYFNYKLPDLSKLWNLRTATHPGQVYSGRSKTMKKNVRKVMKRQRRRSHLQSLKR